jgi:hypothetical protein
MTQAVESWPSKCEAMSSKPSTTKKKKYFKGEGQGEEMAQTMYAHMNK